MRTAPRVLVVLAAMAGLAGCRTASVNSAAQNRPPEVKPRPSFDVEEFVADYNRNASRIRSMEAKPTIKAVFGPQDEAQRGQFEGRLAVVRPRDFKLELSASLKGKVADIGSNDDRFWFWVASRKDKSVYVCEYADLGATTLAATYQPDWIVEAMGLKPITPDEAAQIKVRTGPGPGLTSLTFPASGKGGQTYHRTMIVSDLTHRVSEFKVYSADGKTLLAQATILKYRDVAPQGAGPEQGDKAILAEACRLPENIILEWKRERLSLDVLLREVKVNQFAESRRAALFVEPTPGGYAKVNLAELARQPESDGTTAIRESLPAPPTNSDRVRLNPPLQIRGADDSAKVQSRAERSAPKGPVLLPITNLDEVVGAPIPTAPGTLPERTASSMNSPAATMSIER
jgi:hypothetical protein